MNRFEESSKFFFWIKRIKLSAVVFLTVLFATLYGMSQMQKDTNERQIQSLNNAINRSVLQCYAVEGTYPPSLDYIKEHYGLYYNEDDFFVDYQSIGSNIMPDITVIPLH